jgi:hypothetical protein
MTTTTNNMPLEDQHLDVAATDSSTDYFDYDGELKEIYNRFPADMRPHARDALYYHSVDVLSGELTDAAFSQIVTEFADMDARLRDQRDKDDAIFAGIEELIRTGQIKNPRFEALLHAEVTRGENSLLMRFISLQSLDSPLDAAVSFLAWHHSKALFDLESEFGVSLDAFRDHCDSDVFGTSESQMTICNFSVLSDTRLLPITWTGN